VLRWKKNLANGQKDYFYNKEKNKEWVDLQISMVRWQQRRTPGYMTSILSTIRHFPFESLTSTFKKVGAHRRRGLIIWGTKDIVCPYKNASIIEEMMPHLRLITMTESGHMVLYEKAPAVTKMILAFISVPGGRRNNRQSSVIIPPKSSQQTTSDRTTPDPIVPSSSPEASQASRVNNSLNENSPTILSREISPVDSPETSQPKSTSVSIELLPPLESSPPETLFLIPHDASSTQDVDSGREDLEQTDKEKEPSLVEV